MHMLVDVGVTSYNMFDIIMSTVDGLTPHISHHRSLLQTYSASLLRITVPGIPSMHMCADFIPELLAQPQPDRQVQ